MTLEKRATIAHDKIQLIKRAGYPPATLATYMNGDTADETEVKSLAFSVQIFIRGFDLSLVEFKIVRRCLIICIQQLALHSLKNLQDDEAKWWISEIHACLQKHPLLQANIPAYFSHNMIRGLIAKTVQWMRTELAKDKLCFTPGRGVFPTISLGPALIYHGEAKTQLEKRKAQFSTPLDKTIFNVKLRHPEDEELLGTAIVPEVFFRKDSAALGDVDSETEGKWAPYHTLDFDLFTKAVTDQLLDHGIDDYEWAIGYYSLDWDNQVLLVTDDISLWMAVKELHRFGQRMIEFRVVFLHDPETPVEMVDLISEAPESG